MGGSPRAGDRVVHLLDAAIFAYPLCKFRPCPGSPLEPPGRLVRVAGAAVRLAEHEVQVPAIALHTRPALKLLIGQMPAQHQNSQVVQVDR